MFVGMSLYGLPSAVQWLSPIRVGAEGVAYIKPLKQ